MPARVLSELSPTAVAQALRSREGLRVEIGPFVVCLRGTPQSLAPVLLAMYGDFPLCRSEVFSDYHVVLERPRTIRRVLRPQVLFRLDGRSLFEPFPEDTAFPLFEWGLNWSVAQRSHQFLLLHAATLERNGLALLMPAVPGSGKSTFCAALAHRGWRLLSDEFGMFDLRKRCLVPFPRPVALKNESIEVIRKFASEAIIGPLFPKTRKGTVAHLRPSRDSVARMGEPVRPGWVVFPKFKAGSPVESAPISKAHALLRLAHNSFNYEITGVDGFQAAAEIVRASDCHDLSFGDLNEAIAHLDRLTS